MNRTEKIAAIKKRIDIIESDLESHRILKELKKKGDIHIVNVFRFFGIWVGKDHELRDAVKKIVFGVIYGKGAKTLSRDIDGDVKKAQGIMDKMFKEFKVGSKYLEMVSRQIEANGTVMSPIGRRRNVYRVFTGINSFVASAQRRAKNAPIQGMAAEIGMQTAHLILKESDKYIREKGLGNKCWPLMTRTVHDAMYYEVPYQFVIPFIHIMQHCATVGVSEYFKDHFGWEFTVEPEIEIELSTREDKSYKWDWSLPNFKSHIEACLKDQVEISFLESERYRSTLNTIYEPWQNKESRNELCEKYPLLGVTNLSKQIRSALPETVDA